MLSKKRLLAIIRPSILLAFVALAGCDYNALLCEAEGGCAASTPPVDSPGTFSYYAFTQYATQDAFCSVIPEAWCTLDIQNNFGAELTAAGWTKNPSYSVYDLSASGGSPSQDPTATTVINDHSNLVFMATHGGLVSGTAQICLYYCNSSQFGNDYSVGPSDMPSAWNGPNWLALWSCGAVLPGVGWENLFGGSLHGILGFNATVSMIEDGEEKEFTTLVSGYTSAITAWGKTGNVLGNIALMSALIPSANAADDIEASGGPHFGPNGSTSPQYYKWDGNTPGTLVPQTLAAAPASTYNLTPEAMNESYWYNYYGGSSVPSTITHPSSNEDLYRSQYALVDHFLASGGLLAASADTGTARGFSSNEAYQYALGWIASNGGLPSDAILTYAGAQNVTPNSKAPTSDQPYPSTRQYVFIWRHASSAILGGDHISIAVDDAGALTTVSVQIGVKYVASCECTLPVYRLEHVSPWVPVYHVATYARMWRTLGAPASAITAGATIPAAAYAYCGTDMMAAVSVATPCAMVTSSKGTVFEDVRSGAALAASESL